MYITGLLRTDVMRNSGARRRAAGVMVPKIYEALHCMFNMVGGYLMENSTVIGRDIVGVKEETLLH